MRWRPIAVILVIGVLACRTGSAQELEPRAYRTLPIGLNAIVLAAIYSSGNVVADATSPVRTSS